MDKFIAEHAMALYLISVGLCAVVVFFVKRTLDSFKEAMETVTFSVGDLYDKYNEIHGEFSELKGEHNVFKQVKH